MSFITTGSRLSMIQCTAEEIKPRGNKTKRERDVCLLALAGLPCPLPKSLFGFTPNIREWTRARAGSSACCHTTIPTYQNPRQGYLPTCLFQTQTSKMKEVPLVLFLVLWTLGKRCGTSLFVRCLHFLMCHSTSA